MIEHGTQATGVVTPTEVRELPTGVVTFLLTDVEGSTHLWEADADAMALAMARHHAILRRSVTVNSGVLPEEQGEGDSIVAAFRNASDAVTAALDAQRALHAEQWPADIEVRVRMALHAGEARLRDARNYAGETIIRTARIRSLAHGRQVLASRSVVELSLDRLPDGSTFVDLGAYRLVNLTREEQVFQLAHPELRAEFPPLNGIDRIANNLPTQLTPFIGREAALAQVHALLEDSRLLTLTGSGGCGKTRLALQVAADRLDVHRDGVFYVELAPLGETSSITAVLADALHVHELGEGSLLDEIVARLTDRRALLVVDNCEHLLDEVAALVDHLLRRCPALQVLATSRQHLGLDGEVTWRVPSMAVPDLGSSGDVGAIDHFEAVQLFVERAARSRPNFVVDNDNAPYVAAICQRLDGIPLAIELAAARVRSHPVERIAAGLDDRFRMLRGDRRGALPRHQTLLASVEWSHQLLDDDGRRLLRRLALFSGGFDLDGAEAVTAFDGLDRLGVLEVLDQLVDRSLVVLDTSRHGERYRLLETIKQFAHARLVESDEVDEVRARHGEHYRRKVARLAPLLVGGEQVNARSEIDADRDNVRLALEHVHEHGTASETREFALDLVFFWFQTARFADGLPWIDRALAVDPSASDASVGRLLWARGWLCYYAGLFADAASLAEQAIEAGTRAGDPVAVARAIDLRCDIVQLADPLGAVGDLQHALQVAEGAGDQWAITDITQKIGYSYRFAGDRDSAFEWFERAHATPLGQTSPFFLAWHWTGLQSLEVLDDPVRTVELGEVAVAAGEQSGDPLTTAEPIHYRAIALARLGRADEADDLLATCRAWLDSVGAGFISQALLTVAECHIRLAHGRHDGHPALPPLVDAFRVENVPVGEYLSLEPHVLGLLGGTAPHTARPGVERLAELGDRLQNPFPSGLAAMCAAVLDLHDGDPKAAAQRCLATLDAWRGRRFDVARCQVVDVLAWAMAEGGQAELAGRLRGSVDRHRDDRGWTVLPYEAQWHRRTLAAIRPDVVDAYEQGREAGAADDVDLDTVIAAALRSRGDRLRPSSGWGSLTPTEVEVVLLVAEGLTNPQIAERLFMSRSTVKTHLSHVFTKLAVTNRSELAGLAVQRGLDGLGPATTSE